MPEPTDPPTAVRKREAAEKIVRVLQGAGHVAYFAGGCVRDQLLGLEPKDYDVATDATPEQVKALFRNTRLVGEAFGVVLVRLKRCEIEVATFRSEGDYSDGRRPDHVEFTDAEHDAQRRDFTINGLFYDPVADQVHDFVEGRDDLARRRIRAIGDPAKRFAEDYLRMLRAVRFAARLGWTIDPPTRRAIVQHAPKLGLISRERIGTELRLMLSEATRASAADLTQDLALDAPALDDDHVDAALRVLTGLPDDAAFPLALAAWLLDRRIPATPDDLPDAVSRIKVVRYVRIWRNALALSNSERDAMRELLLALPDWLNWSTLGVAPRKRLLARADWADLHALGMALIAVHGGVDVELMSRQIAELTAEGVAPEPLITGDDLLAAGLEPGPAFKTILDEVYDAQLELRIASREAALALALDVAGAG
jgi:poly(A) polymerase